MSVEQVIKSAWNDQSALKPMYWQFAPDGLQDYAVGYILSSKDAHKDNRSLHRVQISRYTSTYDLDQVRDTIREFAQSIQANYNIVDQGYDPDQNNHFIIIELFIHG